MSTTRLRNSKIRERSSQSRFTLNNIRRKHFDTINNQEIIKNSSIALRKNLAVSKDLQNEVEWGIHSPTVNFEENKLARVSFQDSIEKKNSHENSGSLKKKFKSHQNSNKELSMHYNNYMNDWTNNDIQVGFYK